MQVYDARTKKNITVFKEYELKGSTACPECGRSFKDYDVKRLNENGTLTCSKCGLS